MLPTEAAPAASVTPARRLADEAREGTTPRGRGRPPDRMLHLLLLAAERDVRVGLTVSVGGRLVTGNLVGTVAYCRALADQFAAAGGGTGMDETFAEAFRGLVDDAYGAAHGDRREPADAAAYERSVEFLHLEEARYLTDAGFLPITRRGVLWCCRVDDISSWSLGDLTHA